MALGLSGLSTYNRIATVVPMNYAVENQASFSESYIQSLAHTSVASGVQGARPVDPVQYPNAMTSKVDSTVKVQKAVEANRQLNTVAAEFAQQTVGYNGASRAYGYDMIGSTLDLYA